MPDFDPSQDQDFLKAPPEEQHAYLMHADPDYAKAPKEEQAAYRDHVTGTHYTEAGASSTPPVPPAIKPIVPQSDLTQRGARAVQSGVNSGKIPPSMSEPTQFEKERTPTTSPWETFKGDLSSFGKGALEGVKKVGQAAAGNPQPMLDTINDVANRIPAELKQEKDEGYSLPYRVAARIPEAMGANVAGMEDSARHADTGGVLAHAAAGGTLAAAPLFGEAALKGAKAAAENPTVRAVATQGADIARGAATPITTPLKALGIIKPEANIAVTRAIQPGVNIPRAAESIPIAGERLQQVKAAGLVKDAAGNPITEYKSLPDVLQGIKAAKDHVWDNLEQRTGSVAKLQTPTNEVGDAMRDSISKRTREQYPELAKKIETRAETYDGLKSFRDIENAIQDANDDLKNFYKHGSPSDSPTSAETTATEAEVRTLRNLLDDKVKTLTGAGTKELKREYGALRDVERATAKQNAIATRQKGATLWEGLAALRAAGDFATLNPVSALKGVASIAAGKRLSQVRSPEWLIDQAFQGPKAFAAADEIAPPLGKTIRGLLPEAKAGIAPPTEGRSNPIPEPVVHEGTANSRLNKNLLPPAPKPPIAAGAAPDTSFVRGVPAEAAEGTRATRKGLLLPPAPTRQALLTPPPSRDFGTAALEAANSVKPREGEATVRPPSSEAGVGNKGTASGEKPYERGLVPSEKEELQLLPKQLRELDRKISSTNSYQAQKPLITRYRKMEARLADLAGPKAEPKAPTMPAAKAPEPGAVIPKVTPTPRARQLTTYNSLSAEDKQYVDMQAKELPHMPQVLREARMEELKQHGGAGTLLKERLAREAVKDAEKKPTREPGED